MFETINHHHSWQIDIQNDIRKPEVVHKEGED